MFPDRAMRRSHPDLAACVTLFLISIVGASLAAENAAPPGRLLLAADSSKRRIAIIDDTGETQWERKIGPIHDLHRLESGNILMQLSWTRIVEIDPGSDEIVWEYDSAKMNGNEGQRVEVHAFQRVEDGLTMIAESGPGRIIEVDREGRIRKEIALRVGRSDPHRDTRLARKIPSGNYLVAHEGDGAVREYDPEGKVVWEYEVPMFDREPRPGHGPDAFGNSLFCALRLENGNTLVATGNGHSVIEVTPAKEIVWHLAQDDLPGIRLAWVTTLQVMPGGNLVIGNCHAGEDNPQVIEITRDKRVVWSFRDFERFGDALSNSMTLDASGRADAAIR